MRVGGITGGARHAFPSQHLRPTMRLHRCGAGQMALGVRGSGKPQRQLPRSGGEQGGGYGVRVYRWACTPTSCLSIHVITVSQPGGYPGR